MRRQYSPDREYVDGAVVERHVGERPHSFTQGRIDRYIGTQYPDVFVWPEQRVRTIPGRRSRVPDVCVTLEDPQTDVFESPPFIVIEILSKRDEMSNVLEKPEEYSGSGVPYIWLLDPCRRKGFHYVVAKVGRSMYTGRLEEVQDAFLTESPLVVRLPLEEIFRGL